MKIQKKKLVKFGGLLICIGIIVSYLYYNNIYNRIISLTNSINKEKSSYEKYVEKENHTNEELVERTKKFINSLDKYKKEVLAIDKIRYYKNKTYNPVDSDVFIYFGGYKILFEKYNKYFHDVIHVKDNKLQYKPYIGLSSDFMEFEVNYCKESIENVGNILKEKCNNRK